MLPLEWWDILQPPWTRYIHTHKIMKSMSILSLTARVDHPSITRITTTGFFLSQRELSTLAELGQLQRELIGWWFSCMHGHVDPIRGGLFQLQGAADSQHQSLHWTAQLCYACYRIVMHLCIVIVYCLCWEIRASNPTSEKRYQSSMISLLLRTLYLYYTEKTFT
jgi:hypothetical protein